MSGCWCSIDKSQRCVDVESEVAGSIGDPELPEKVVVIFSLVLVFWWRSVSPIGCLASPSENMSVMLFGPEDAFFSGDVDSFVICGSENGCMHPFIWMMDEIFFCQRFVVLEVINGQVVTRAEFFEKCIVDWIILASLHFSEMHSCESGEEGTPKRSQ